MAASVGDFLGRWFAFLVIGVATVAFLHPPLFVPLAPWINTLLGIVMLGMGLTLTAGDFRRVLERPGIVALGLIAQYAIMAPLGWCVATMLSLPPMLFIGVILVGTCPGGTASNVITYLARGDVALSVSMTLVSTLISPVLTPLLTQLLAGEQVPVAPTALFRSIALVVLLPVVAGVLMRYFLPRAVQRVLPALPVVSVLAIVLIVAIVVALNRGNIRTMALAVAAAVILHNLMGLLLGYAAARLFRLDRAQLRTLTIEVGMQNSGLAAALGKAHFDPMAALPGALFSVWHNISGPVMATIWNWLDERKPPAGE